jgi:hypothetical protein
MFYEVRIFNAKGKLKKVLSGQELSQRYWKRIQDKEAGLRPMKDKVKKISNDMRRELDALFPKALSY